MDAFNVLLMLTTFGFLMANSANASEAFLYAFRAFAFFYLFVVSLQLLATTIAHGLTASAGDVGVVLDFVAVAGCIGVMILTGKLKFGISLLRIFRLPGQLERLTPYTKSTMFIALVETLTFCVPEFCKIILLLLIAIYIFAGWCVPVFGNTRFGFRISSSANFQSLPNALGHSPIFHLTCAPRSSKK